MDDHMSFQWLQMRITEELERREREAKVLDKLPQALDELRRSLSTCLEAYTAAFGADTAALTKRGYRLRVAVRESTPTGWQECGSVEVDAVPEMPGLEIRSAASTLTVEVGMLPGDKVFYRDREVDQYLTMEELTRRILDRTLFPKLKD
jgi:hypothetical protein